MGALCPDPGVSCHPHLASRLSVTLGRGSSWSLASPPLGRGPAGQSAARRPGGGGQGCERPALGVEAAGAHWPGTGPRGRGGAACAGKGSAPTCCPPPLTPPDAGRPADTKPLNSPSPLHRPEPSPRQGRTLPGARGAAHSPAAAGPAGGLPAPGLSCAAFSKRPPSLVLAGSSEPKRQEAS